MKQHEIKVLEELGRQLSNADWASTKPLGHMFDDDNIERAKFISTALQFLEEYKDSICSLCCVKGQIKPAISTATDIYSAVADAISAIHGLPIPANIIANAICKLGLLNFCSEN